ncbi:hypothetical protein [Streptosporangium sp. NPDC006007]|uniref:hypothetical protein n=1 Tax=Streptosporangium sp. NPDC006007 TaxID=3154575 RepID=UPI0033ABAB9B
MGVVVEALLVGDGSEVDEFAKPTADGAADGVGAGDDAVGGVFDADGDFVEELTRSARV